MKQRSKLVTYLKNQLQMKTLLLNLFLDISVKLREISLLLQYYFAQKPGSTYSIEKLKSISW